MATKNYYQTLGVSEASSADEIKKAYRKLAKKFHPDATGGDKTKEAKFKEISEAHETLGDEKKRAAYDEQRRNPFGGGGYPGGQGGGYPGGFPGGQGGYPGGGGNVEFDLGDLFSQFGRGGAGGGAAGRAPSGGAGGFSDLFNMFDGGAGRAEKRGPKRGQDVISKLEVELPEAALGAERTISIDGKKLTVKIPRGVTDGKSIRLTGQGEPAPRGGTPGDLLIEIAEKPHPRFRRRAALQGQASAGSADIEVEIPISIETAILGGKAEVPTLEGPTLTLNVPPGTSSGKKLRLKGKGAYLGQAETRGDLYAIPQIQIPINLSDRAKELLEEFAKLTK